MHPICIIIFYILQWELFHKIHFLFSYAIMTNSYIVDRIKWSCKGSTIIEHIARKINLLLEVRGISRDLWLRVEIILRASTASTALNINPPCVPEASSTYLSIYMFRGYTISVSPLRSKNHRLIQVSHSGSDNENYESLIPLDRWGNNREDYYQATKYLKLLRVHDLFFTCKQRICKFVKYRVICGM